MRRKNITKWILPTILVTALFGCVTISSDYYKGMMRFDSIQSQSVIDATARIEASHTFAPEVATMWKNWLNTDDTIANYQKAISELEAEDMVKSGLFKTIVAGEGSDCDFLIRISSIESKPSQLMLKLTMEIIDPRRNEVLTTYSNELELGTMLSYGTRLKEGIKHSLADMRTKLLSDYNEGKLGVNADQPPFLL